ncbi:MAG: hypothetical protein V1887_01635 [Candidatus Aenigmatarchaeota archaeon]
MTSKITEEIIQKVTDARKSWYHAHSMFELARDWNAHFAGFRIKNINSFGTAPARFYGYEMAQTLSTLANYNGDAPRFIVSTEGDITVYVNMNEDSLVTLAGNGDVYYFEKIDDTTEMDEQPLKKARRIARSLAWPLKSCCNADYEPFPKKNSYTDRIEILIMGGNLKTPEKQVKWRQKFRNFGVRACENIPALDGYYEAGVWEEKAEQPFRLDENGMYKHGFLKTVVKIRRQLNPEDLLQATLVDGEQRISTCSENIADYNPDVQERINIDEEMRKRHGSA